MKQSQDKLQFVNEHILPHWEEYCLKNWLTPQRGDFFSAEEKVKIFLDSCAYLLLRDNPEGTLTLYKQCTTGSSEIPVSSCPTLVENQLYGTSAHLREDAGVSRDDFESAVTPPRNRAQASPKASRAQKSQRLARIRKQFPGCTFIFCRVDTSNRFVFGREIYQLSDALTQYEGTQTKHGLLYDMEQVVVMQHAGHTGFYDQSMRPIDVSLVQRIE